MNPHAELVDRLDKLRDFGKAFTPKARAEFDAVTDSIETITRAYMLPEVEHDWSAYHLTRKETRAADYLLARKGKLCNKEQFLNALYGDAPDDSPDLKIVDVYICKIRKKLVHFGCPYGIDTVWGQGYRLVEAAECGFESRSATCYVEIVQPQHIDTKWDNLKVPDWSIPVLEMLAASRSPVTAEALSVASNRSISDFQNRLRDLRAAIAPKYLIFNTKGLGYTLLALPSVSAARKAA